MVNLLADRAEFVDGIAHKGMLRAIRTIMEDSAETLKEAFEAYPDYRFVITGHSLGAGCSILASVGIRGGEFEEIVPSDTPLKCVAVAPPMVYRQHEDQGLTEEIAAFVKGNDPVCRLSTMNLDRIFKMAFAIGKLAINVYNF